MRTTVRSRKQTRGRINGPLFVVSGRSLEDGNPNKHQHDDPSNSPGDGITVEEAFDKFSSPPTGQNWVDFNCDTIEKRHDEPCVWTGYKSAGTQQTAEESNQTIRLVISTEVNSWNSRGPIIGFVTSLKREKSVRLGNFGAGRKFVLGSVPARLSER